jgi:hypothetical protein
MSWSRSFDKSIQPPKGKKLVTLKDAAAYIIALPKSEQQAPEWQAATEALLMAAEDRGPLMHAHVGMMLALHGAKPIPEYDVPPTCPGEVTRLLCPVASVIVAARQV